MDRVPFSAVYPEGKAQRFGHATAVLGRPDWKLWAMIFDP
jgi:hypothetical protein